MKKLLALCFLLAPALCTAAEQRVTVREAVTRALAENPQVRAAALRQEAAREAHAATRSAYLPRLELDSGAVVSNTPSSVFMMKLDEGRINPASDFSSDRLNRPGARGDFSTTVTLQQPLLNFGIATAADMAGKDAESAESLLHLQKEQTALRVYEGCLEVRKTRAHVAVADQALEDAREHERLALVREKNGVGLRSDTLRARTEVAQAEQAVLRARNDHLLARMTLNLAVGGTPGDTIDVGDDLQLPEPHAAEQELAAQALTARPDLGGMEKQVEKARLAVTQAERAYLPVVYANAAYRLHDRDLPFGLDKESWGAGINLHWEIFDGGRRSHLRHLAHSERDAAEAVLYDQRRHAVLQITESTLRLKESELRLVSARRGLQDAEEGRRLVQKRYENGLSTMVELLDAEGALNAARANLVERENGRLGAIATVYFSAGTFLQEVMR